MLEHYFLKPDTIDHIRASWIGEPIEQYVTWLHEQGYAARIVPAGYHCCGSLVNLPTHRGLHSGSSCRTMSSLLSTLGSRSTPSGVRPMGPAERWRAMRVIRCSNCYG